jgi:glycosyltransferase involved in cell wall biosynthesis
LPIEPGSLSILKDVWVLIPAHNEESAIGELVRDVRTLIPRVLVVDDGSRDATSEKARAAGAVVVRHEVCTGKGGALRTGFSRLEKEGCVAALAMDGDGQHLVSDVPKFLAAYRRRSDIGMWVGKRRIRGTEMPFIRRATNIAMSFLISLLAVQYVPDTQNGFRLVRLRAVSGMDFVSSHFETESEILLRASWRGERIGSVPIETVYSDERSKIRPSADTARFFTMLFRLVFSACKSR